MNYLMRISLASLVLSVVVLTAGVAAAEVGIPFGLKWGDSPETVEKTCKKLFGEYTKKKDFGPDAFVIESEVRLSGYKFRVGFLFDSKEKLYSIHVSSNQTFEKQRSYDRFIFVMKKYFLEPFDSLPEYRIVRSIDHETVYITPNSRISVLFRPVNKEIEPDGKSFLLSVTWDALKVEKFFIE